jgi:hypothetical protein
MGIRTIQSTGPLSLSGTSKLTDLVSPESMPDTVNSKGEAEAGMKASLLIAQVDVGNECGNTAACGWGFRVPGAEISVASFDGSDIANAEVKYLGSAFTDGAVLLSFPYPVHAVELTFGNTSNANVSNTSYYNGALTVFPALEDNAPVLDATNTACTFLAPKSPADWSALAGKYLMSFEVDANVIITAVSAVRLLDYVDVVANGNALSKEFVGEMKLPAKCQLVAFVSEANANNWAIADYSNSF